MHDLPGCGVIHRFLRDLEDYQRVSRELRSAPVPTLRAGGSRTHPRILLIMYR